MKRKKRPRIVSFAVLTTITLLTWVVADLWRTFTRPVPVQVDPELLQELNPDIDRGVVAKVKESIYFSDQEARQFSSQIKKSLAPVVSTESAQVQEGTGSGETQ